MHAGLLSVNCGLLLLAMSRKSKQWCQDALRVDILTADLKDALLVSASTLHHDQSTSYRALSYATGS